jgi:hypothetical protein
MDKETQPGVYALSAVPQLSDDRTFAVSSFGKFICVMIGYAGGESTSQIVINRPLPVTILAEVGFVVWSWELTT